MAKTVGLAYDRFAENYSMRTTGQLLPIPVTFKIRNPSLRASSCFHVVPRLRLIDVVYSSQNFMEGQMIAVGQKAPDFALADQFGRKVSLAQFAGKQQVMLLFYPLDFTPT